jgi:hypothetical protein
MRKQPDSPKPKRRYVRFTRWRRRRFFALLEESGNVRLACELAGVGLGCIYTLRRREAGFVALMEAAVAEADRRLALREGGSNGAPAPWDERWLAGAPPVEDDIVIRHGIGGRLRLMAPANRWWAARHDAIFLGHLRETGNIAASARAAGFTPKTAYNRRDRRPSFARAWEAALDESERRLDAQLTAEALKGSWAIEPDVYVPDEPETFDVDLALRLLTWREKRRLRRERALG